MSMAPSSVEDPVGLAVPPQKKEREMMYSIMLNFGENFLFPLVLTNLIAVYTILPTKSIGF
jgi:hypothetical protein